MKRRRRPRTRTSKAMVFLPLETDEDRLLAAQLSVYAQWQGEPCRFCGKEISLDDAKTAVFAGREGDHQHIAHKACWDSRPGAEGER